MLKHTICPIVLLAIAAGVAAVAPASGQDEPEESKTLTADDVIKLWTPE